MGFSLLHGRYAASRCPPLEYTSHGYDAIPFDAAALLIHGTIKDSEDLMPMHDIAKSFFSWIKLPKFILIKLYLI